MQRKGFSVCLSDFELLITICLFSADRWSDWVDWSPCSATCGVGMQMTTRRCLDDRLGSLHCRGLMALRRPCSIQRCLEGKKKIE